jgi:tetratricopeptide (TPR) repeat protein
MMIAAHSARIRYTFFLLFLFPAVLLADTTLANSLLQQGRVDEAAASLHQTLAAESHDALAHQLLCRVFYSQGAADAAIRECEAAVSNDPSSSDNEMWLGRAYGLKASHASPLVALKLAIKVRVAFERAVELDSGNVHAMSDLGEFYVAAPSLIGGGLEKARALAATMQPRFPTQAHRLLALVAEKNKDEAGAEAEYTNAVRAGRTAEAYIDLGRFYQRHNQSDKMFAALQAAISADHHKGPILVDAAGILSAAHREPDLSETLLRNYLNSPAKTDEAPAFKVHIQLGDLLAQRGDLAGAHREYADALALASNYPPARKAVQSS